MPSACRFTFWSGNIVFLHPIHDTDMRNTEHRFDFTIAHALYIELQGTFYNLRINRFTVFTDRKVVTAIFALESLFVCDKPRLTKGFAGAFWSFVNHGVSGTQNRIVGV